MSSYARKTIASVVAATAIVGASAVPAGASTQLQDGLVNVAVGDVTLKDTADVNVAAEVAANVCGVDVGPIAVLAEAVDADGETRTVCQTDNGPITISN